MHPFNIDTLLSAIVQSVVFSLIGMGMFALAMWIVGKVLPFSLRKEIEDDQNTSLGIVLGSIIIGLSLILSSAIR
jgi:putative membrane protein